MIMNKMLALCMSPDQGGLELYFLKFIKYYNENNLFVAFQKTHIFLKILLKNKLNVKPNGFINKYFKFPRLRKFIIKKI